MALKRNTDPRVRAELAVIAKLDEAGDPKSIAALGDMLADSSPEVRSAALSALTDKDNSLATQMIRRGLNDRNPEFRIEALEALAERKDIDSLRRGMADSNEDVRERAAELLKESTP
jgi:HEAT repeat protein